MSKITKVAPPAVVCRLVQLAAVSRITKVASPAVVCRLAQLAAMQGWNILSRQNAIARSIT